MTNKKFKLAAMSLALTACVAASPLAANAESADAEVNKPASTTATSTDETKQNPADESKQDTTNENEQDAANNNEQEAADENKQEAADKDGQETADENKQETADENKQEAADENEQEAADKNEQEAADENEQDAADKDEQEAADKNEQEAADENEQEAADKDEQEAADKNEQEAADKTEQEAADKNEQETADKNEQEAADKNEQETADKNEQETADENKQEAADKTEQETSDKTEQETTEKTEQEAAVENKAPAAAAPVAKAPVLMTASLAAAPAAPAAPAEENTAAEDVATINGKGYKSFDAAVEAAESGDTIEVIKDATSTGIDLQNKNLTIKGKTVTTTTDSGTEEKTTVKPKLKFVAKDGQPQIFGITLRGSDLTFQNMDVDMTGASSTTYNKWNAVCMSHDAALTLDNTKFSMDGTGLDTEAHGIYMAGRGRNELNVNNHSTLTINNCFNAIAWDGVGGGNEGSTYFINITDGSTFTADGNNGGIIGREALDVLVDNSTLTVTNCANRGDWEGRSGFNGADVKIVNGSTANISGNHGGYGIHANNLLVENSTLTANDNGYGGIRITGKGEFTNSTVTVTGTEEKGNASVEITWGVNDTETGLLNGSLSVRNSTLNISDNNATGIACLTYGGFHRSLTIDDASRVTIQNNNATPRNGFNAKGAVGGGLRIEAGCSAVLGRSTVINNNSADKAGADIFIEKGGKLTFSVGNAGIGDILNKGPEDADCGHKIDGWYIDANGSRWNFDADADAAQAFLDSLDELPEGVTVNYDQATGLYTIAVDKTAGNGFALKAAHAELPAPTPDPDGPDTPTPNPNPKPEPKPGPDTSITPEDPQLHPVQDARADTPDSPVLPANRTNPAVQDAHALPQTGTSLFAALAMALGGFALTIAGAWASLLGKNNRH